MEMDQTMVRSLVGEFRGEMEAASVDADAVLANAWERVAAMQRSAYKRRAAAATLG